MAELGERRVCILNASVTRLSLNPPPPNTFPRHGQTYSLDPTTVEYAMEAISHAGTVLGVLAKDGVVLAAEKKVTGKLLDLSGAKEGGYGGSGEKIYLLNSCVSPPDIIGYTSGH
ncbi:hypothetical protein C0993_010737 [Termitomyces sp. T159_Od127]|nr:hypothetical protein C0993_010737 [Termitomyces sp. T159_Od127]